MQSQIFLCNLLKFSVECNMIEYVYIYSLAGSSAKEKEIERMNLNIVCIPGDGIGPEIVAEAKNT